MTKKILLILAILFSTASYSQLTDANFQTVINTCLATNPDDGLCSNSEYGAMPDWDVSQVTDMSYAFTQIVNFNGDISDWDVSKVTDMDIAFDGRDVFNVDISNWDVSSVTNMSSMFFYATSFNQSLNNLDISSVINMQEMFSYSSLSTDNYDGVLNSWSQQDVISGVILRAIGVNYCNGEDARQNLIDTYGWIITDDGLDCATAGVDDQNQLDISIYPNPTSDIVYIGGNYTQLKVVVYDILGKQVMNKPITNHIDISQLDKGVYILQLSDGAKLTTQRILKK